MEIFTLQRIVFVIGLLSIGFSWNGSDAEKPDPRGYVMYCPCMGRFGNQAEQFVGALVFAKSLNRILVVPPWVEYRDYALKAVVVPYETYFKVEALKAYHDVISMEEFMETLASTVWPKGQRKVFCYSARDGPNPGKSCNAKDGNPFGPFWDSFNIDFDQSEIFGPLYYDTTSPRSIKEWKTRYPVSSFPVLAFVGPPSSFPMQSQYFPLQKHIKWSDDYDRRADEFVKDKIRSRPYLAIHLRNGIDFERACEHVSESPNMFAAQQCIGERGQYGPTTREMCYPSTETVVKQVKKELERIGAKTLFIATDHNDLKSDFARHIKHVAFVTQGENADPLLDLAILGRADHFIGNCVSTFTAFVKRERDVSKLPSSFWAFEKKRRDEL